MSDETSKTASSRQLARSTLTVMIAFAVAKIISLGQTVIIASVFGVGAEWDAFVTANRIPELIFTLISGGALAHAFVPIFSGYLAKGDKESAWKLASHVVNLVFITTATVSAIVFVPAPWLVANVAAPGFNIETQAQTTELMRILLIGTLIFSVSGLVMGILNSHNHFLLPALAPILFDVGILIGVIFLLPILGVRGIAIGAVLGACMHLGVQIPGLIRFRAKWYPEIDLRDPVLWRVIRLMLPRVAGLGVFSLNFLAMNNIASRLGTGAVSALDWGWRLMQIPQTLIGTAMGTVIFPTLAAFSELGDENGKRGAMSGALRFILVASIPSAVGLIFVGRPIIGLLERGAFDASASELVYTTLRFFALGMIAHSALEVVARSFYADKDTLTPLWAALVGAGINFIGAVYLSNVSYAQTFGIQNSFIAPFDLPYALDFRRAFGNPSGLALANTIATTVEVAILMVVLRKRWNGIHEDILAQSVMKALFASLVMATAIVAVNFGWNLIGFGDRGLLFTIAQVVIETGIGAVVFFVVAWIIKMEELRLLLGLFRRGKKSAPAEATP
ncbi:MAG TPA: murein biosynthesis integral membrane protein MurJ [Aggregatilineales bacterium]|nr:murein biosynthesis integral membrane protein MurJ [Aggregatilineales bacterium]